MIVLATDSRWPLDADGLSVVRELEQTTGAVTLMRVPDGAAAYRFVPEYEVVVIVSAYPKAPAGVLWMPRGGTAWAPPAGWQGLACWHVERGCEVVFGKEGELSAGSVTEFAASVRGRPGANLSMWGWMVVAVVGMAAVGWVWRRSRRGPAQNGM